jgi:hypothetical protein
MAEMSTDAAALSAASTNFDGIRSFFLFEDRGSDSQAGASMQDTEKAVGGMFASAGDAGGEMAQKLGGIWGGSGSDAYQQTQQRGDSTAADTSEAATSFDRISSDLKSAIGQVDAASSPELNTISENTNRSGTQYQSAADDAPSSLANSMGFTPPDDGFDFKAADAGEETGYQSASDDAASSLGQSMGFAPIVFGLEAMEPGETASDALKYNFSGIEGSASGYQPDTDGGWLLGHGDNGGIPATMAEWALLLA